MVATGNKHALAELVLTSCSLFACATSEQGGFVGMLPFSSALNGIKALFVPPAPIANGAPEPMNAGNLEALNGGMFGAPPPADNAQLPIAEAPSKCQALTGPIAALLMSTCQTTAATKTGFIWGSRLKELFEKPSAEQIGDGLTSGLRETCEQMAQKQACDQLGATLAQCDVAGAIGAFIAHVQSKQRCRKLGSLFTKDPDIGKSVGGLVGNEFIGSLMQKFLG